MALTQLLLMGFPCTAFNSQLYLKLRSATLYRVMSWDCKRTGWDVIRGVTHKQHFDVKTVHMHAHILAHPASKACDSFIGRGLSTLGSAHWTSRSCQLVSHSRAMPRQRLARGDCVLPKLVGPRNVLSFINLCVQQSFTEREEEKWKVNGREHLSDISHQRARR